MQTLLKQVGSHHLINTSEPEDLPGSRRNWHNDRVLFVMPAASLAESGCLL